MPDVVIWMLSGSDRVAYYRIPAYDLLYNKQPEFSGQFCKKVLDLELKVSLVTFIIFFFVRARQFVGICTDVSFNSLFSK